MQDQVEIQESLVQEDGDGDRYRIVSELMSDYAYAYRVNTDGLFVIEWMTKAFERITGFTPDEVYTQGGWSTLVHPDDLPIVLHRVQALLSGQPDVSEYRIISRGGKVRWLREYVRPVVDETRGRVVRVIGAVEDITERKQAEEDLQASEERYRSLFDGVPVGLYRATPTGQFLDVNPALVEMLGYPDRGTLLAVNAADLCLNPQFHDQWQDLMERARIGHGVEMELHRHDGTAIWVQCNARPVRDVEGRVSHYEGSLQDITERKQVEDQLRYLSIHDILTGLHNRTYFEEELARLESSRLFPISVVMIDLDGLKAINDSHGHAAGDECLRQTARVLRGLFRAEDVVARIGGDEFAVLLPNTSTSAAAEILTRIRKSLAAYNDHSDNHPLSLSIGIATGNKGCSLLEVMKEADQCMYQEKMSKDGRVPETHLTTAFPE